jgi:hypothetical protein
MNLVQINERLKDLPMQVIQQYANGMNPEVPPYLALGELQRRELSQKQMATAQGAQQGPQPSVKEQVEQKAGLMELQQMQQQQMAQKQAMPRGPMPAPAGVPQPEQQPEMMARGGLASVPVRSDMFEYADGGIVAFQSGGQPKYETRADKLYRENREAAERKKSEFDAFNAQISDDPAQVKMREVQQEFESLSPSEKSSERGRRLKDFIKGVFTAPPAAVVQAPMADPMRPAAPVSRPAERMTPQQMEARMAPAGLPGAATEKGISAPTTPRPTAPRPAPDAQPAGLTAAVQDRSPYFAQVDADLAKPIAAPTPEGIIAQQRALSPEVMQEEFMKKRMEEQRQRAASERAAFDKTRPSGLDDLIRVFGQAGQYKGLSGLAPAYTANKQQQRAEELAMEQRQNQLLNAIDAREYEGGKELFGARSKSMDAANTAYQNQLMTRTKSLADMAGVDQRRMDEAANRLTQVQLEKMRIAARAAEASRPGEAERIEAKYMSLLANNKPKEAEEYLERISKIKSGSPGSERNKIMDRRQDMAELQVIMKNESGSFDQAQVEEATKEYGRLALEGRKANTPKFMTQADVLATAKSSGKTPQQVIEAAKARGYEIK